ncbi:MAG: hypothetical protein ACXVDU_09895 [Bacteroidia bacterium]
MRLNWVAKDSKGHCIISISHGGYSHRTLYYYFDHDKGKLNVNELLFTPRFTSTSVTFGTTVAKLKKGDFKFLEYSDPDVE